MPIRPDPTTTRNIESEFRTADIDEFDVTPPGVKVDARESVSVRVSMGDDDLAPPNRGFGRLWHKVHRIPLAGVDRAPEDIVEFWKEHFHEFWPGRSRFRAPIAGIRPGELALVKIEVPGGATLSSGIVVVSVDPDRFVMMTPIGHMFTGRIAFSADSTDGPPAAQIEIMMRASDPLFELGMISFGHRRENRFWEETLRNLARTLGVNGEPATTAELIDSRYKWSHATNLVHNAAIRSFLGWISRPLSSRLKSSPTESGQAHQP